MLIVVRLLAVSASANSSASAGSASSVTTSGGPAQALLATLTAEGLGEVAARGGGRARPAGMLVPCCPACLGSTGSGSGVGAVQMLSCSPGGRCLRSVLLSLAKLAHRGGQVEETGHQRGDGERAVAADVADQCEQPAMARNWSPLRARSGMRPWGRRAARSYASAARRSSGSCSVRAAERLRIAVFETIVIAWRRGGSSGIVAG